MVVSQPVFCLCVIVLFSVNTTVLENNRSIFTQMLQRHPIRYYSLHFFLMKAHKLLKVAGHRHRVFKEAADDTPNHFLKRNWAVTDTVTETHCFHSKQQLAGDFYSSLSKLQELHRCIPAVKQRDTCFGGK